jgi:8-oxo-dGTP pyrophosphatase MutT (NUDIX family)
MDKIPHGARVGLDNGPYMTLYLWPFVRGDGSAGLQTRVRLWDGTNVIALDEHTNKVYVVEQKRETEGGFVTTIELPGGGIDPRDAPLDTARKELLEEAGVVAVDETDWVPLYKEGKNPIDGLTWTRQHSLLLLRGRQVSDPSDGEIRRVTTIPLSKLIALDNDDFFRDPLGPYAMRRAHDWLAKNRPDLLT